MGSLNRDRGAARIICQQGDTGTSTTITSSFATGPGYEDITSTPCDIVEGYRVKCKIYILKTSHVPIVQPYLDHGEPCGDRHRSFCLNGGICYVIPSVTSPFCRCSNSYTGFRCEDIFLPSKKAQPKTATLTNILVLAVVICVVFVAVLYFICRTSEIQDPIGRPLADNCWLQNELCVLKSIFSTFSCPTADLNLAHQWKTIMRDHLCHWSPLPGRSGMKKPLQ
ncbi:pro-neuregulin-4, membrane-bound isoform [Ambystoma mexicanum]|uniref:pro-neuregulin-4, membrane-bound isoform n=1 Tax=Ambystoma mexicanum TaxID=8296 RepID=UPI0037E8D15B